MLLNKLHADEVHCIF